MKNNFPDNKSTPIIQRVIIAVALILALFSIFILVYARVNENCADRYSFVNKRFACFEKHTVDKKSYAELKTRLVEYIQKEKEAGNVDIMSLYFRDLESGPTMGINERIDFVPASLLKLPNAMILLRLTEEGELDIEEQKLFYTGESEAEIKSDISFSTASVADLIFKSLVYSDNLANSLLVGYIKSIDNGRNLFLEIDRDLGTIAVNDTVTPIVNTKGYGAIFRMLYNSSFLNPQNSEKLLEIMSQSVDTAGLAAGVPKGTRVAHKFGQRNLNEDNKQLHDCGIVYYPENPYLLCIMTRGKDVEKLHEIITVISAKVYSEFDSRKLK